jgi:DNA-binding GntR family transcriptional regulator
MVFTMAVSPAPDDPGLVALEARARGFQADASEGLGAGRALPLLREAIVAGELLPGARLSEAELARRLGISRTPVREALTVLEREGLVTSVPRLGAFVRTVTETDVDEIYAVREALEVLATQLVVDRVTPVGLAHIDEEVERMRAAVAHGDPHAYVEQLDAFYALLVRLAGNATLEALHRSLLGPVRRLRRIAMTRAGRMQRSFDQAEKIAQAIAARDTAAGELMREQIRSARAVVKDVAHQAAAGGTQRR